jgi:YfiH family protein
VVTTTPRLLLAIATADCAPVLLADPAAEVVGACHAGWRGAVAGIAARTVQTMVEHGARPSSLRAHVGPCLSREAFEVGPEVAGQFDAAVVHRREAWPKPHVDLKDALRRQLCAAGLTDDHIEMSGHCTLQEDDTFFSHRASGGTTGRMFGAIVLRP